MFTYITGIFFLVGSLTGTISGPSHSITSNNTIEPTYIINNDNYTYNINLKSSGTLMYYTGTNIAGYITGKINDYDNNGLYSISNVVINNGNFPKILDWSAYDFAIRLEMNLTSYTTTTSYTNVKTTFRIGMRSSEKYPNLRVKLMNISSYLLQPTYTINTFLNKSFPNNQDTPQHGNANYITESYIYEYQYGVQTGQITSQSNYYKEFSLQLIDEERAYSSEEVETAYNNGQNAGYNEGYNDGYTKGQNETDVGIITQAFKSIDEILSIEIFPNVQLWLFIGIPLIISLIFLILKFFH